VILPSTFPQHQIDHPAAADVRFKCSFPEEGRYTVQVWFFQEQGSDVLKGEMPFFVKGD
jgi:hypothetical protein